MTDELREEGAATWPAKEWRCQCGSRSYVYFDEPDGQGGFRKSKNIRCIECKREWYAPASPMTVVEEFVKCLNTMSHSRAGWDYELSREQREKEDREEKQALARARVLWAENGDLHDDLRAAFTANQPLATMREIEPHP